MPVSQEPNIEQGRWPHVSEPPVVLVFGDDIVILWTRQRRPAKG